MTHVYACVCCTGNTEHIMSGVIYTVVVPLVPVWLNEVWSCKINADEARAGKTRKQERKILCVCVCVFSCVCFLDCLFDLQVLQHVYPIL